MGRLGPDRVARSDPRSNRPLRPVAALPRAELDQRVGADARQRELGEAAFDHALLERDAPDPGDVALALRERASHAHAQALEIAAAVVDEVQPPAVGIAGQARDHTLAPVETQRAPFVAELAPQLQRERAGIDRLLQ